MKEKTITNPKGAGRAKGKNTHTIAFEADLDIKIWYESLDKNKSQEIRDILKKYLTESK